MPRRDGVRGLKATSLLQPINRVADADSAELDVLPGDSATLLINLGDNVNAGFAADLEEADEAGGPWTSVGANDRIGDTVPVGGAANTVYRLGYVGNKRYCRAALTIPASTDVGVVGLNGELHRQPEEDL
ncbi:MAG: hypothetical protein GWN86_25975 [Desulfobacterales bacterium]|nr:hypothetical protein [Desulfobacterales bacterium]